MLRKALMLPCMALAPSLWLLHAMHGGFGCFEKGATDTFASVWGCLHGDACRIRRHALQAIMAHQCYMSESSTVALWLPGQWPGLVQQVLHDHHRRQVNCHTAVAVLALPAGLTCSAHPVRVRALASLQTTGQLTGRSPNVGSLHCCLALTGLFMGS